jgi:hypothetical protein
VTHFVARPGRISMRPAPAATVPRNGSHRVGLTMSPPIAVRYLATIRIAAINEWLPRHL